jgi:integrase
LKESKLADFLRAGPTQPARLPVVEKFVAFLSQIPPRGPFLPVVPVYNYCTVNNMRFMAFLDTEEVAGSNPVVPTKIRFRDIQRHPVRNNKPLINKRFIVFLRPEVYRGSHAPVGVLMGVDFPRVGVFPLSGIWEGFPMALTDTEIRRSKPGDKPYKLSDGGGLHLMVTPSGGKLWRWKYRFEGAEKLMALGRYPEILLGEARERRDTARKRLANSIDPMAERKAEKTAVMVATEYTFEKIAEHWLEHWRGNKSARHAATTRNRLRANVYPILGSHPIAEIEPTELVELAKGIETRGASDMAKRILQIVGMVLRYAVAHGYSKRNPASEIRPSDILKPTRKKNMARIDAKELPTLLRSIELYQGTHLTRLAMKMMAQTFVRTSELICARWDEFDLEANRWTIPAERMKMKTPHIVALSRQTMEVLELLHDLSGSEELLFPGEQDRKKPMSNMTILKALERMGYKGRMTGHGFRGLASTILHEQGYNHDHIELQLAHAPRNAVSAAYNHALYLEPRAKMMQDWADFLERTQRGGKVLPFCGTAA